MSYSPHVMFGKESPDSEVRGSLHAHVFPFTNIYVYVCILYVRGSSEAIRKGKIPVADWTRQVGISVLILLWLRCSDQCVLKSERLSLHCVCGAARYIK